MYLQLLCSLFQVILLLRVSDTKGQRVGCGDEYNTKTWNCDKLIYFFLPSNLEQTLYCIGYNKLIPNLDSEVDSNDSRPSILIDRRINSLEKVDEETNLVYLHLDVFFELRTKMFDFQFNDCKASFIDFPPELMPYFIPIYGKGMTYDSTYNMWLGLEGVFAGSIGFRGQHISKEPCIIDLKRYPFDEHDCEIKLVLLLQTRNIDLKSNQNPLEGKHPLLNPGWTVQTSNITIKEMKGNGIFSQHWTFNLRLKRDVTSILMHFYLPSIILCFASMMSLFIHHDLLPARMCLSVTTCLSLITLIIGAK